jgi:HSP20 family protein
MNRSLLAYEPFNALLRIQERLERALEGPPRGWSFGPSGRGVFPPVNVFSGDEGHVLRMEVPGLSAESITIRSQSNTLEISGKREPAAPSGRGVHRRERWSGEFSRAFRLPRDLDVENTTASYRNGVLTVHIPRRETAKPRQITVTSS